MGIRVFSLDAPPFLPCHLGQFALVTSIFKRKRLANDMNV